MKKAISLFLALSVLCFATSAMAKPTVDDNSIVGDNRTATQTFYTGDISGAGRTTPMPGFRPGDTISFTAKNLTVDSQLTVISYKCNDANLSGDVTLS
nr:hypothetical protein [Bacillota bacterium]